MAACLAAGPDAVASHRTAARLWELVPRSGQIEILLAEGRRVRLAGIQVHRSVLLSHLDCTSIGGIAVSSLARTIADVSSVQGDQKVVGGWVDAAMRRNGLDLLEVRSCIARLDGPGRSDLTCLRQVLARRMAGYDPGDSELEVRALRALDHAHLPAPVQQHPVELPGGRRAFIDLAYPSDLVAIELDGWDVHGRRSAFDHDRARRNDLTLLGWRVYQFTSSMSDVTLTGTIGRALGLARSA